MPRLRAYACGPVLGSYRNSTPQPEPPTDTAYHAMRRALILSLCLLCGCYGNVLYQSRLAPGGGAQSAGVSVQAGSHSSALAGVLVIGVLLADGMQENYPRYPDGIMVPHGPAPALDPNRRINIQDCTQPVDLAAGNLMCR